MLYVDSHLEHSKLNGASTALKQDIRRTMRKVGDSFKKEVLKQNRSISADEKRLRQASNSALRSVVPSY